MNNLYKKFVLWDSSVNIRRNPIDKWENVAYDLFTRLITYQIFKGIIFPSIQNENNFI